MARLYSLSWYNCREIQKEVGLAIEATKNHLLAEQDMLCCGNFGRLSFLWDAAIRLNRGNLKELVERQTAQKINEYFFEKESKEPVIPNFMRGVSGIGYF